ncbi:MAG TPA: MFS transporter [Solibacterales bacterium]|nr:MFS transporter [Bryobacterales bacterium]
MTPAALHRRRTGIPNLRWWIGGLLLGSTVINYLDRQTLSVLAPFLMADYHWSNSDFATILISFRLAYTVMQMVSGKLLDRVGTRKGLAISVSFYSAVAALGSLASGLWGFRASRFLLGCGEAANWPGAAKAVSEWFPDRERAWAVALFDSGSSLGGAIAPWIFLYVYHRTHSWRPVMAATGLFGFLWVAAWLWLYYKPKAHPRVTPGELHIIESGQSPAPEIEARATWRELLGLKQTWGIIVGRALLDPYWFLVAEWFGIYLVSRGIRIEQSVLGFWAPFLAADIGNFFGAGLSSYWIKRGWPVGKARRTTLMIFGPCMLALIPATVTSNYWLVIALFAFATFAYACCATMFLSLPADVFQSRAVASVSGLSGTGAGLVTLLTTYIIGRVADSSSFQPIIIAASLIPCVATVILVTLVRAPKGPHANRLLLDF